MFLWFSMQAAKLPGLPAFLPQRPLHLFAQSTDMPARECEVTDTMEPDLPGPSVGPPPPAGKGKGGRKRVGHPGK